MTTPAQGILRSRRQQRVLKRVAYSSSSHTPRAAGLLVFIVAAVVLVGWVLQIEALKALGGPITMKANAAACLLALGIALQLLGVAHRAAIILGIAASLLVSAVAAATVSQHVFGWNLGIDELLFPEPPGAAATASPGRMGPNASTCLTLAGVAVANLYRRTRRAAVTAQVLGALVMAFALIPTVGYLYGSEELYAVARITGIGFHTGVALLILGLGIVAARPTEGPVASLLTAAPHGIMARRLLATAVIIPLVLGYVRVAGERRGLYDVGLGSSLFVVAMIVLLSLTIWRTAVALGQTGADLERAEQARNDLLARERAAREKAEQADRAKDEFIAALSHELRTPLNAILGWMYMLRNTAVPEEAKGKAADAVVRNAGLLARLIEELLDTSRITTGRLELARTEINLHAVVQAAIESVVPASAQKGVPVSLEAPATLPTFMGDEQRLQQVVWNLLSNAIKFSAPGGHVVVQLWTEDGNAVVSVRDDGVGIDPAFLPQVFEQFQQADSSASRAHGGLGLGLYIAKHLTELHGGSLEAHSAGRGKGATFTMRIPLQQPSGTVVPTEPATVQQA